MSMLDGKLEIFRMAAALENFSGAASALGMTQPNVTARIAMLEEDLGVTLFERAGRGVALTPAGRALLEECEHLFADASAVRRRVGNAAHRVKHFRIGGTMTAGGYLLPGLAVDFMDSDRRFKIDLHIANTDEISGMLKTRSLDMALVEGPFDRDFFFSRKYISDELAAICAPGFLGTRFSLKKYIASGGKFVLREQGSGTRRAFDDFLAKHRISNPPPDSVIIVNSFDAIKHFVRRGNCITVMSLLAAADEIKHGTLAFSRFSEGVLRREMNFIYAPESDQAFAEMFIRFSLGKLKRRATG